MNIRCVDKGVGVLWAFCRNWMWSILQDFLKDEGYICAAISSSTPRERIRQEIHNKGWDDNKAGQLAVLYLIGKGKSLKKGQWLWRGITALPQPLLSKRKLRIAARANTTFLRLLSHELPTSFVARGINSVSKWFH